jgi:hypothetical protein
MEENNQNNKEMYQEVTATHSGWHYFYPLFQKYRDECMKLGQIVLGTEEDDMFKYLKQYISSLYSMAQQTFSFYSEEKEKELTNEWLDLLEQANEVIYFFKDRDFKTQMKNQGQEFITKDFKLKLIMYFNKVDRMAAKAGLLVGQENKSISEPKKGMLGL